MNKPHRLIVIAVSIGIVTTVLSYLVVRDGWWLSCNSDVDHPEAYSSNEKEHGYPAAYYQEAYPKNCYRGTIATGKKGIFYREKFTYNVIFWSMVAGIGVVVFDFATGKMRRKKR